MSNTNLLWAFILGSLALISTPVNAARYIDWGGSVYATNLESDLVTPLDATYVFYLGSFGSFTPTTANLNLWSEQFTTLDAANYHPAYGIFSARHTVSVSDPVGQQAYIWGVRRTREDMEWILITDSNWIFPADDDFGAKLNWMVKSATSAILGSINGPGFQMMTAAVPEQTPIPIISYNLWTKRFFADGDADAATDADPNDNQLDNLIEYALDAHPRQSQTGALIGASVHHSQSATGKFLGVIVQPSLDAYVEVLGWVSPDITFSEEVSAAVIEELEDGSLLIRDTDPISSANARKFIRIEFREPD